MAYKIVWSAEARANYISIIEYLQNNWSEKEIETFVTLVHSKVELLSGYPNYTKRSHIRRTVIHKHVSLVYHVNTRKSEVTLLTLWDTRQDPAKLRL